MSCKVCKGGLESYDLSQATGVCEGCRKKLGIVPMPPSNRRPRPCAHCRGMIFVRVVPRELSASIARGIPEAAPMTATLRPDVTSRAFLGTSVAYPSIHGGAGQLEMYICRTCGLVEWHCVDPEAIPIGSEYMTELVDHSPASPYRG